MSDIIDVKAVDSEKAQSLKTVGWVSYLLHLIVAVAAVLPGAQASPVLLIIALIVDLVKKRCRGHLASEPFLLAHPHRHLGRRAVPGDPAAVAAVPGARLDCLVPDLHLVPLPHRQGHGAHERQPGYARLTPPIP